MLCRQSNRRHGIVGDEQEAGRSRYVSSPCCDASKNVVGDVGDGALLAGADGYTIKVFFLSCVVIAGVFGAATASRKILWVQAVPGAAALALVCAAHG